MSALSPTPDAPPPGAPSPAAFVLALVGLDGVGRVAAHRVAERFPSADALRATPREQVRLRLKGLPRADRTVGLIADPAFDDALAAAGAEVAALAARGVTVLAPGDPRWPAGLADLERAQRPALLWVYGPPAALARPALAVAARPPVPGEAFEAAQRVARAAAAAGLGLVLGAAHGFDLALAKVALGAGAAPVLVAGSGLTHLAPSLRPAATAVVRAGGALVSSFPMDHGPFEHDDRERALVQTAVARGLLVAAPQAGSPEARAAAWAAEAGRPLAVVGDAAEAPGAEAVDDAEADFLARLRA